MFAVLPFPNMIPYPRSRLPHSISHVFVAVCLGIIPGLIQAYCHLNILLFPGFVWVNCFSIIAFAQFIGIPHIAFMNQVIFFEIYR